MIVEDQREVLHALSQPSFHGDRASEVERIDTHISVVFLAGDRVLKLKRAVKFGYVDFSTVARRKAACEAEVKANARMAPSLYRGVVTVTRAPDGSLELGGPGVAVDYLVDMTRFDQATLFDRQAERGQLTPALMRELARAIADYHQGAAVRYDHGGLRGMTWVVDGNLADVQSHVPNVFGRDACTTLADRTRRALAAHGTRLDARRTAGHVRQCHGDLHLRNICLVDGRPTLFDAIEFNDELSCVDTAYDLAFLLMDLEHRELHLHANAVLNAYVERTGDRDALALLPLFLSCRAAVRAKIGADAADVQNDRSLADGMRAEARRYLDLALTSLAPPPPSVMAVGGLSGSGKSTVAAALAPRIGALPGAIVLRSDVIRKRLWGTRSSLDRLPPGAYTPEVSARVYETLVAEATEVVGAGHAVIVDAVFLDEHGRRAIEDVAARSRVPFRGFWLDAPPEVLATRVASRVADASDADAEVVARQRQRQPNTVGWMRIDATPPPDRIVDDVLAPLRAAGLSRGSTAPERRG